MSKDYREYAKKEITPTMAAFADWLREVTGIEDLDTRTVALAGSLRGDFQKSDFWKADPRNYLANVEANREAKARAAQERAEAAAAKAVERARLAKERAEQAAQAAQAKADALTAKAKAPAKAASKAA